MDRPNDSDESPREPVNADLLGLSPSDIADSRSVRTTFRMTEQAYEALSWLARYHGISRKETIHRMAKLPEIFLKDEGPDGRNEVTKALFEDLRKPPQVPTKRRSQVATRGALRRLKAAAETHHVPRDRVLEVMLLFFKGVLEEVSKEWKEKLRKAEDIVGDALCQCEEAEAKLGELLPDNHPVTNRMGIVSVVCSNLAAAIQTELEGGSPVDFDDFSQTG